MDRELELDRFDGSYSWVDLYQMNARFTAAMGAAIRPQREHPPLVEIDHTPGTKNLTCYVVSGSEARQRMKN
jgi:hypothetical protein